jgi:cytosine/adenosine deaminase-related metal-dependent hydrolase
LTAKLRRAILVSIFVAVVPAWPQQSYSITGTIVTAGRIIENGTILVSNHHIQEIGTNVRVPPRTLTIAVQGVIFPGLIDLHNHLVWNVFPRWRLDSPVANRYEWQAMPEYEAALDAPHAALIAAGSGCDMQRYAEVKALLGGATSVVGSYGPGPSEPQRNACVRGLARNLDVYSGLYSDQLNAEPLRYETLPLEMPWERVDTIRSALDSRELRAVLSHVAEGKDAASRREFAMFKARGFLRAGVSIIHGVALHEPEFREMAAVGVGLIWSPRSNLELYGATADVASALAAGVTVALAPDWSPSGSSGMLDELRLAGAWSRKHLPLSKPETLLLMATSHPARLAGLSDQIGTLEPGMMADFIVLPKSESSPLDALLQSKPASVQLVVVGGKPLLGIPEYMEKFRDAADLDIVTVCGERKALNVRQDIGESWSTLYTRLSNAMASVRKPLAGLSECSLNDR